MDLNATLFGQMLTFIVLVWFIKAYLWEPLTNLMAQRQKRIADGLAAGERGLHEKELAENRAKEVLQDAKAQAAEIIAQAQKRAGEIVEESKGQGKEEGQRLLVAAKAEIEQESNRAREQLRDHVASLAVVGAKKILSTEINQDAHKAILDELVEQL